MQRGRVKGNGVEGKVRHGQSQPGRHAGGEAARKNALVVRLINRFGNFGGPLGGGGGWGWLARRLRGAGPRLPRECQQQAEAHEAGQFKPKDRRDESHQCQLQMLKFWRAPIVSGREGMSSGRAGHWPFTSPQVRALQILARSERTLKHGGQR